MEQGPKQNIEQLEPIIKTNELLKLIPTIQWEDEYNFEFNGTQFNIFIITEEDLKVGKERWGSEADFSASTVSSGYDIYLHDTIPPERRTRVLFHEILEANLIDQNFNETAHDLTLAEEEKVFGKRD